MFKPSLLAASVAACSSFAVYADTTLPIQIVTATRTTQTADQVLASVQVLDRSTLDKYPNQDLGEVLRFTTGIDVVRSGGLGGQISTFIRGTESNHTLVLIDGVRINSATSSQASMQNLTLNDVDRVEVVKGPMSSLYGSEAIGGVINIITKTVSKNETQARLTGGTNKLVSGAVSQSFKQNALFGLVDVSKVYSNGYADIEKNTDKHAHKNDGINAKIGVDTDTAVISAQLRRNQGTTEYWNYGPSVAQDFVNQVALLTVNGDISSQVNTQLNLSQMTDKLDQKQSADFAHSKRQQADWQNTIILNPADTVVAGATYTKTTADYNQYGTVFKNQQKNWAVYLQNQWRMQAFDTQLSVRHDDYDSFGGHNTGNIALGYTLTAQHRIYANAGTAFKTPDLNDIYGFGGNINLTPETSRSVEIGSQHKLGSVSIKTAFFKTQINDLINSRISGTIANPYFDPSMPVDPWYNSPTMDVYTNFNVDKASTKGVELGIQWADDGFFAGANGSYIKAQDDNSKKDLLRRPRRSITVTTGYQQASWGISAEVLGKSHAQDSYGRLAGYAVANVEGYWQVVPSTKLRLSIENISDKTYGSAYALSNVRYLATPLSASLSAEVKF